MNPYYILVLLGVAMVSYSGPLVKGALLAGANPVTVAMMRMVLSAGILLVVMCIPSRKKAGSTADAAPQLPILELRSLTLKQWLWSLLASACLALHYFTWMTSLDSTSTFASVALVCTQPLFVAALSGLVLHEPMPKKARPGAIVALLGAVLIGLNSITGLSGDIGGDLLALAGAAMMAGHWLCSRYARRSVSALPYNLLVYTQTAIILGCIMPFAGAFQLTPTALLYILGLAVGCTMLGHTLFTIALGKVTATVVSFALLGEPVGAMVWSMLMFGEIPTPLLYIGGGVVLLGLVMYTIATMRTEQAGAASSDPS